MSKKIAILGATGAVGRQMMSVLEERNFPFSEIYPLSSARSAGSTLRFMGEDVEVQNANDFKFEKADIVLGAASSSIAKQIAPIIKQAGAVFVDNSSAFRLCDDVPLIVPEINGEDAARHNGIISNPNCSTIITLMAVYALHNISPITSIIASTYQAASGAGAAGPVELTQQVEALGRGENITPKVFAHQLAYNVIPDIGGPQECDLAAGSGDNNNAINDGVENVTESASVDPTSGYNWNDADSAPADITSGYTTEEMKMQNEGRKILHAPNLNVTCTCVRVPVIRSHSISASVFTEKPISVDDARKAISNAKGCVLADNLAEQIYPMPLDCSDKDTVFVGRIRRDLTANNGLALWCCGDQVRKGAATNTVQIAELL